MEDPHNYIYCKICMFPYDSHDHSPKIIPCGHSFCWECIKSILSSQKIQCPMCKKMIDKKVEIPINFEILDIINSRRIDNICLYHRNENLNFFCKNDRKLICQLCLLENHMGHEIIKPSDSEMNPAIQLFNRFKDFVSSSKNTKQLNFNSIKENFKEIDTYFESIQKDILEIKNYVKYETLKTFNHLNNLEYDLIEINDLLNNEFDEIYSGKKLSFSEKIVSRINEIKLNYSRLKNLSKNVDNFGEDECCILLGNTMTNLSCHLLKMNEQYKTNESIEVKSSNDIVNMIEYLLDGRINSLRYDTSRSSKEHLFMINESLKKTKISCENIGNIMKSIDRKDFISNNEHPYVDKPIIIGWNTTISAPHMQIITLFNLSKFSNKFIDKKLRALDIGSGSGYMTLCLSKLLGPYSTVIGIDHIKDIVLYSICNINKNHGSYIQTDRIKFICKEGRLGDKENGPYHIIHFGAALEEIPLFMVDQLEIGGVMWIPVGPKGPFKKIIMIHKEENNKIVKQELMNVNYTELVSIEEQLKINSEIEEINEDIENSD